MRIGTGRDGKERRRYWRRVALLGAAALLPACAPTGAGTADGQLGASPPDIAAADSRSVLSGVFTAAQASRGQEQFQRTCASCHAAGEFSGPVFQRIWADRPVGELFQVISTMMPQNDPGSLSAQEYADVVSYFLRQNGYPEGQQELPGDPAALDQVIFEPAS